MTKTQLIDALMKEVKVVDKTVDLNKKETKAFLAGLTGLVEKTLKKGDDLPLSGLGKFKVQSRKARIGRNPQTGAEIKIAAKKVVKFTVAKNLKDTVLKKAPAKKK